MTTTDCGFSGPLGPDLLVLRGPTLSVDIGFDPAYTAGLPQPIAPNLALKSVNALVDTGATECCIDTAAAMILNLPIIDQREISGVGGRHTVNMHLAQIWVPTLQTMMYGAFAGVDLIAGGQVHAALMGRTFLRAWRMDYQGDTGAVILSTPPQKHP